MKIKWLPPLDRMFGQQSELPLSGSTRLTEVLTELMSGQPGFEPYAKYGPGDTQPYGLMVWRQGEILTLNDHLQDHDEVEMIVMVSGG